jgi:hypothetical protein
VTGSGIEDTRTTLYTKPQRHANYLLVRETVAISAFSVPQSRWCQIIDR